MDTLGLFSRSSALSQIGSHRCRRLVSFVDDATIPLYACVLAEDAPLVADLYRLSVTPSSLFAHVFARKTCLCVFLFCECSPFSSYELESDN